MQSDLCYIPLDHQIGIVVLIFCQSRQVRLSYVDELMFREERRQILLQQFFFHCRCERCLDDDDVRRTALKRFKAATHQIQFPPFQDRQMSAFKCPREACTKALHGITVSGKEIVEPSDDSENGETPTIRCNDCGAAYDESESLTARRMIGLHQAALRDELDKISDPDEHNQRCRTMLQAQAKYFHPTNTLRIETVFRFALASTTDEDKAAAALLSVEHASRAR